MQFLHILQLLVLLTLANGTPIVAKKIFGPRFARPLDGGIIFLDGRPLFGHSKTIRGILTSILITTAGAPLIGLDPTMGAIAASAAMAGDLFSSFVKRRLNFPPSSQALGGKFRRRFTKLENKSPAIAALAAMAPIVGSRPIRGAPAVVMRIEVRMPRMVFE